MDKEVETYAEKVSGLLVKEFMEDVDLRYDYLSDRGDIRLEEVATYSREEKEKLYDWVADVSFEKEEKSGMSRETFDNRMNADLLGYIQSSMGNYEKFEETKTMYNHENQEELSAWLKKEFEKFGNEDISPYRDKYYQQRLILLENEIEMKKVLDAQANRTHEYSDEKKYGYCLRSLTASLYKQQVKYPTIDFLPSDITKSVQNVDFIAHMQKNYPNQAFETTDNQLIGDVIEKNNIRPGAIVSLTQGGIPKHAMMYTHKDEEGDHILMGFNNETKDTKASLGKNGSKRDAIIIDIPKLFDNGVKNKIKDMPKEQAIEFLKKMEVEINKPIKAKNFQSMIDEGKKYSPEKQWSEYYNRSDVKFDTKAYIEEVKNKLKERKKQNESNETNTEKVVSENEKSGFSKHKDNTENKQSYANNIKNSKVFYAPEGR